MASPAVAILFMPHVGHEECRLSHMTGIICSSDDLVYLKFPLPFFFKVFSKPDA